MTFPLVLPLWVAIPVVALFIPITAIIVDAIKKIKEREHWHQERLKAIEMGQADAKDLLTAPPAPKRKSARKSRGPAFHGTIWAGLGLGLLISTFFVRQTGSPDMVEFATFLMVWAIPALTVGTGLVIYGVLSKSNGNGD